MTEFSFAIFACKLQNTQLICDFRTLKNVVFLLYNRILYFFEFQSLIFVFEMQIEFLLITKTKKTNFSIKLRNITILYY